MHSHAEHTPNRPRRSARQWRAIVERFQQSRLSPEDFCRQHNLGLATFDRWRRRFLSDHSGPGFVQLQSSTGLTAVPDSAPWALEVDLPGGLCLRIRGGR